MKCYICGSKEHTKRNGSVMDNKSLEIFECDKCGLVFLSDFSHIDETYYEESNMNTDITKDMENWLKETKEDDQRRYEFVKNSIINHDLMDFGSGAGGFLIEAKSSCKSVSGLELDKKVKNFYESNGVIYENDIDTLKPNSYDTITMFHVMEHLSDPVEILKKLASSLKDEGSIIIEVPNANDALLTIYENEGFSNFTYWSCHLFLFTQYTLEKVFKRAGYKVEFIKHIQRYPLSNHMFWLAKNKPGGHKHWSGFLDNERLNKEYEASLASIGATDTIIAKIKKQ
jgi:2-polyprenyl-3-methyl-5-hydroxy-6-metoxy-1,4-benzoquinol methylase